MAMLINLDAKHNWRLKYHLQAPNGNITDPNGLCYFKGLYHVFHQYVPRWPKRGHGWGHWTSPDLITWTFHGGAIMPDCELDANGSYSGSALIKDGKMWCYYTGNFLEEGDHDYDYSGRRANETLTVTEDGLNFGPKELVLGNAGYPAYCSNHVRDPKVWEQDGALHMLLGARTMDDHGCVLLYRSDDGHAWTMEGSCTSLSKEAFGYMWECPNLVKLDGREFLFVCPQGKSKEDLRFQNIHNSGYFALEGKLIDLMAGDKDLMDAESPHRCIDERTFIELDYGFDFYAPQVFTDDKGRSLLIGWVGVPDIEFQYDVPTREWAHTVTMPRVLSLNEVGRVCQWPVDEMDALHGKAVSFTTEAAHGASGFVGSSSYDMFTMDGACGASFAGGTCDVRIENIQGEGRLLLNADLEFVVHGDTAELVFLGPAGRFRTLRRLPLSALSAGKIEDIRLMVDTSVVELFVNGGEVTLTTRWFPMDIDTLHVTSTFSAHHGGYEMGGYQFKNC